MTSAPRNSRSLWNWLRQPDPSTMVRLASCQIKINKFDEAIAVLDKALADPSSVPAVKNAAVQLKLDANKAKAAAK